MRCRFLYSLSWIQIAVQTFSDELTSSSLTCWNTFNHSISHYRHHDGLSLICVILVGRTKRDMFSFFQLCSIWNRILSSKNLVFRFSMLPSCNLLVYAIWFLLYLIFARSTAQNFPAMIAWMCQWISDSESGAGDLKCRDAS